MSDIVAFDGGEIKLENRIDGGETNLSNNLDGGEISSTTIIPMWDNYNDLSHKPKINGVEVIGSKLGADYKLQDKMQTLEAWEIEKILYLG